MEFGLKQEVLNLNRDETRKEAQSCLRNHIRKMDDMAIPQFLADLAELQNMQGYSPHIIDLYKTLVREHGRKLVPYISRIMGNLMEALSSESPSLTLQKACARVVSALAAYANDPGSTQKDKIIRDVAYPLMDSLLGTSQSLAEGAAICILGFLSTESWKHVPDDIVNDVCLKVTAALEEQVTQTICHMRLACSLARLNSLILEAYARSLMKAAAEIIDGQPTSGHWQLRVTAVNMVYVLLHNVNKVCLDMDVTVSNLRRWTCDRIPAVKKLACQALDLAQEILKQDNDGLQSRSIFSENEGFFEIPSSLITDADCWKSPCSVEGVSSGILRMADIDDGCSSSPTRYVPGANTWWPGTYADPNSVKSTLSALPSHKGEPTSSISSAFKEEKLDFILSPVENENGSLRTYLEKSGETQDLIVPGISDTNIDSSTSTERIRLLKEQRSIPSKREEAFIGNDERVSTVDGSHLHNFSLGSSESSICPDEFQSGALHERTGLSFIYNMLKKKPHGVNGSHSQLQDESMGSVDVLGEWKTIGISQVESSRSYSSDNDNNMPLTQVGSVRWTRTWDALYSGCTKAFNIIESIMKGSLLFALAIPLIMVAVKLCRTQEECHVLAPT